jgi:hypothetical protein
VLWGTLAALVAGAVGVVAMLSRGEGGGGSPSLPLALAGAGAEPRAVGDAALVGGLVVYVPAEDLTPLGGEGPAFRLPATVDESDVAPVAAALGIEGRPTGQDGGWHVEGGDLVLDVYGATWSAYRAVEGTGGGVSGSPGGSPVERSAASSGGGGGAGLDVDVAEPPEGAETTIPAGGTGRADPGGPAVTIEPLPPDVCLTEPGAPDGGCLPPPQGTIDRPPVDPPRRPADLPSLDEAERIARRLLTDAGMDLGGARVTTSDATTQWLVTVEPRVGGLPSPGTTASVSVGPGGRIESAFGHVGRAEELGDYQMLDTPTALDRLDDGGGGGMPVPLPLPADGAITGEASGSATAGAAAAPCPGGQPCPDGGAGGGELPTTVVEAAPGEAAPGDVAPTTPAPGRPATTVVESAPGEPAPDGSAPDGPAPDDPASDDPARTGGEPQQTEPPLPVEPAPMPPIEPSEVVVTDAEVVLVAVPSWDGTGSYLVPGYRFTADDGSEPQIPAVVDEALTPPPDAEPRPEAERPAGTSATAPPRPAGVPADGTG